MAVLTETHETRAAGATGSEPSRVAALELTGVTKQFRGGAQPVLLDVQLRVDPGEVTLIGGRNGAGKTTLLRIASGLITPDSGSVHAFGLSPERDRREYQMSIGFLSAGNSGLYARLTVRQHLAFWSALSFVPHSQRQARIDESLDQFALGELADRRVDRMSMGQRQRVRIAMTFLPSPRLVMLDEPASSLDDEASALLVAALSRTTTGGGAVVLCSPSAAPDGLRCDQRYQVRDGALVGE